MKVMILHNDYGKFLDWLYEQHVGLAERTYEEQLETRKKTYFAGTSIFYTKWLRKQGHNAVTLYPGNRHLQKAWSDEHGDPPELSTVGAKEGRIIDLLLNVGQKIGQNIPNKLRPYVSKFFNYRQLKPSWYHDILESQILEIKPDVILNKGSFVNMTFFNGINYDPSAVVSSIGLPSHTEEQFEGNDGIISHIPGYQEYIEKRGYPSVLLRHAFAKEILSNIPVSEPEIPVSFVGSLSPSHQNRIRLLEILCEQVPIQIWAPSVDHLDRNSPIRDCYQGEVWGLDMYKVLANSKITINRHINDVSTAANLRLFEATGVGTMLLTDDKDKLSDIFLPGEEIECYTSPENCVSLIEYYLDHNENRQTIAKRGQERTLSEHTYKHRAETLESFFQKLL